MERTIVTPDFKGGIWHRFFAIADKKDETLKSILDEKIRFYKLYYPFLEKKQIIGKAYEELGIPHICGEVNRKELYKLFLQKRKKQATTGKKFRDSSHKYPKLLIEINPGNKSLLKKPVVPSKPKKMQVKLNKVQSKTEMTQQDITFNKLLFEGTNKKDLKERKVQDMYLKQPKSVRFNEGIEIYRVSPAQPMYKLKPIGRLFDEPSSVRTLNLQPNYHREVQEETFYSDSEFDADTGIISDPEEFDLEDSPQIKLFSYEELASKNTEIIGANVAEICSQKTETTTTYSCSDEEVYSTDSDMAKNGNKLILSSKMITVAQGKWVRKTEKIIQNTNQIKILETPNTSENENVYQYSEVESEIHIDKNDTIDESLIERIKGLYLSDIPENKHKNSEVLCSKDNNNIEEIIMEVEKEKLITETLEVEQKKDNKEIGHISCNAISNEISSNIKSKNANILLRNDFNKNLVNKALITVNVDKHSYAFNEVSKTNIHTENNSEKEIKTIHDKMIHDNNNIINDWDSTDQSDESTGIELKYTDKSTIANQDSNKQLKSMKSQNKILAEEKYFFDAKASAVKDDISEESNLNNSLDEENQTKPSDSLCSVNNTDISLKITLLTNNKLESLNSEDNHKLDGIKPKAESSYEGKIKHTEEPSGFKEPLEVNGSFITPNTINVNTPITIKNERLKQKEIEVIQTSKTSTENSTFSNLKELSSNNYSSETTAITAQSQKSKGECYTNDGHKSSQLSNDSELLKDETKSIPTCHVVSKLMVDKIDDDFKLHLEKVNKTNLKNLTVNIDTKILVNETMPKSSTSIGCRSRENFNEDDSLSIKPFISDRNLLYEETESELCDLEAENIYQGYVTIKSEPETLDYLSKVHMWSLYSKNYIEDFIPSESTSVKTTINTDSAQREITETSEEGTKNSCHEICELETHSAFKDIKSSKRIEHQQINVCESSFESPNEKMEERGSSFGTVTPINTQHNNSNEVSTAYETDPETGKLKMNRSFRPLAGSTPVGKPKGKYQEEYFQGNQPDKRNNSSRESHIDISFEYANKIEDKYPTQDKDDSSSTEGTLKSVCQNHSQNYPQSHHLEPNISPNLTITSQYFKKSEMYGPQKINVKNEKSNRIYNNCEIKKSDLNNFEESITENYINNHKAISRSTALFTYHEDDNNKTSNESIIESRDHKVFRNLKNDKNIKNLGSIICFKTQQDDECNNCNNFIENNDSKIYDKLINVKREGNTPIVSETATSITEPTENSNKTANESMIDNNDSKSKNNSPSYLTSCPNLVTNSDVHENSELKRPLSHQKLEKKTIYSFENSHVNSFIRNSSVQQICDSNKGSKIPEFMYQCPNDRAQNTKSHNNLSTNSNVISFVSASVETKTATDNYNIYKSEVSQSDDSESTKIQDTKHTTISDCIAAGLPSITDLEIQVLPSVSPQIVRKKYYLRSKHDSSSLKRKFKTSYEKCHGSGYSLSSKDENFELVQNVSSTSCTIKSTAGGNSESSAATETDIVKMNVKRVNTNIRKKRAKLIKENPVKRSSTSSSEDEVKKSSLPLKKKRFDINRPLVDCSLKSQIIVNSLPKELVPENYNSHVKEKITKPKSREDCTDQEEDMVSRNFPVSSEDKASHDRSGLGASRTPKSEDKKLKLPQETELYQSTESIEQTKDGHRKYSKEKADLSYLSQEAHSTLGKNLNFPLVSSPIQTISQTEKKQIIIKRLKDQVVTNPIVILNTTRKSHLSSQFLTELPLSVDNKLNDSLSKQSAFTINANKFHSKKYNSDFSASSNSIIGPSPNTDREENEICKVNVSSIHNEIKPQCNYLKDTYNTSPDAKREHYRSENQSNWLKKRKQIKEKARHLSDQLAYTHKKSEKSNVSYWLYRKGEGDKNKKNLGFNESINDSNDPGNKFPRTPLGVIKGKPDNESNRIETKTIDSQDANPDNLSVQSKVKNTKSSIVSWVGSTEADRMATSPEVRTLLRRTYFMGKNK